MNEKPNDLKEQLALWARRAYGTINEQLEEAAEAAGFCFEKKEGKKMVLIDNKKVSLKHNTQAGKLTGWGMFTYCIYDNRLGRFGKKHTLLSVEFTPAGYVIYREESAIKVVKPKIIKLN